MMPVQVSVIGLGPHQSRSIPPIIGNMEFMKESALEIIPNWVLLMPSSSRSVFLRGPRLDSVHVEPMGKQTTQANATHLNIQGTSLCIASQVSSSPSGRLSGRSDIAISGSDFSAGAAIGCSWGSCGPWVVTMFNKEKVGNIS